MFCLSLQSRSGEEQVTWTDLLGVFEVNLIWRPLLLGGLVPTMAAALLLMTWYFSSCFNLFCPPMFVPSSSMKNWCDYDKPNSRVK